MNSQDDFETGIEAMFPGLAGGGSSYLSYIAIVSQAGTSSVDDGNSGNGLENTLGAAVTWSRVSAGVYRGTTNIPFADINKISFGNIGYSNGTGAELVLPISDFASILGYISYGLVENLGGGFVDITIQSITSGFVYDDISVVLGGDNTLRLPEVRYYYNA